MIAYDFELPRDLEAREPAELRGSGRDDVRLLVTSLADDSVAHAHFRDLPRFLRPGFLRRCRASLQLHTSQHDLSLWHGCR